MNTIGMNVRLDLRRIEKLLEVIAVRLGANMVPFDRCACGHERREHNHGTCDGCDDPYGWERAHEFRMAGRLTDDAGGEAKSEAR